MADTTFDEELDLVPGLKYAKNKAGSVSVAVGAPSIYDNAKPIPKVDLEKMILPLQLIIKTAS